MKKTIAIIGMIGIVAVMGMGNAWAGRVGERQLHQEKRIAQGIRSHALTPAETRSLVRQQVRIQHFKRHALRDGRLTPRERARLEHLQAKASHHIYRLKHNHRNWR